MSFIIMAGDEPVQGLAGSTEEEAWRNAAKMIRPKDTA